MTEPQRAMMKLLLAGFLSAFAALAGAAPLSGAVSSAGTLCLGSSPDLPVGSDCTHEDASDLIYLDFINGALAPAQTTATPGEPGKFTMLTAFGDLDPLFGVVGLMNDIELPGPGDPLGSFTPLMPLWEAVGTDGATYTYDLETLIAIFRVNDHALDVRGNGTLCRDGADCSVFNFIFTTQDTDGAIRTTFSLSQSAFPVPEPVPLALLGLGLVALAVSVSRRRAG